MTIWRIPIASWISTHTHTHNMQYWLLFYCNNGCKNAPQLYVIRTLQSLFCLGSRFVYMYTRVLMCAVNIAVWLRGCRYGNTANVSWSRECELFRGITRSVMWQWEARDRCDRETPGGVWVLIVGEQDLGNHAANFMNLLLALLWVTTFVNKTIFFFHVGVCGSILDGRAWNLWRMW